MMMSNFIDEAERHAELYGSYNTRQQMLLAVAERIHGQLAGKEHIRNALHAVNASSAEINWLQRTGHLFYLG